ncbi:hypothetical protein DXG01_016594 [Tephrocybe rancida]|nr:hypothetical protein DXG01_016594 [Tephrocybe rancida]
MTRLYGPRYCREEEDVEKTRSYYSDDASIDDTIAWTWRECTRMQVQEAYDFCLTVRPTLHWNSKKEASEDPPQLGVEGVNGEMSDGMEKGLAVVGFPSAPPPARRSVLSGDLFESPQDDGLVPPLDFSDVIPKVIKRSSRDK